jgi:hypothetical protein
LAALRGRGRGAGPCLLVLKLAVICLLQLLFGSIHPLFWVFSFLENAGTRNRKNHEGVICSTIFQMRGLAMLYTILIVLLILALVGSLPTWPYSGGWGYYPTGGFGIVLLILIVLLATGRI